MITIEANVVAVKEFMGTIFIKLDVLGEGLLSFKNIVVTVPSEEFELIEDKMEYLQDAVKVAIHKILETEKEDARFIN